MRTPAESFREALVTLSQKLQARAYNREPFRAFKLNEDQVEESVRLHSTKRDLLKSKFPIRSEHGDVVLSWPDQESEARIDELARQMCITSKRTELDWCHGYILDSLIKGHMAKDSVGVVCDFGTARGFSAAIMAEALSKLQNAAPVITFDILPHDLRMHWDSPSDRNGKVSRQELWDALGVQGNLICLEGPISTSTARLGGMNILVAFLDSQHSVEQVRTELEFVLRCQKSGGLIIFDDYGSNNMAGVLVAAQSLLPSAGYRLLFQIFTGYKTVAAWKK